MGVSVPQHAQAVEGLRVRGVAGVVVGARHHRAERRTGRAKDVQEPGGVSALDHSRRRWLPNRSLPPQPVRQRQAPDAREGPCSDAPWQGDLAWRHGTPSSPQNSVLILAFCGSHGQVRALHHSSADRSVPVRSASPPGQTRPTIRRIVAVLGATRTLNHPTTRAPRRARECCGALANHGPIAVYERAPATTAQAATSSTATDVTPPRRRRGSGNSRNRSISHNPAVSSRAGDLIRQTLADRRQIEAPMVRGDLGRSPVQPELRCVRDGPARARWTAAS